MRRGLIALAENLHRLAVEEVIFAESALESSARALLRRYGSAVSLWVLSDERTETAAGERWKRAVHAAGISSRILAAIAAAA